MILFSQTPGNVTLKGPVVQSTIIANPGLDFTSSTVLVYVFLQHNLLQNFKHKSSIDPKIFVEKQVQLY